jgi:hypothetical protein
MPKEKPLLKISLSGPGVKPGRIALPVLLKVCHEVQTAINRQAAAIEAKKSDRPAAEHVLRECELELIALRKGSTTLDFAPANKQMSLLPDMAMIGVEAVNAVAKTVLAVNQKRGKWKAPDPLVLDSLEDLGTLFDAGINKVKWTGPPRNGHKATSAEFIPATLKRLRLRKQESFSLKSEPIVAPASEASPPELVTATSSPAPVQESFLEGLLEAVEGKVRITPATGPPSTLSYDADKFENILIALHKPVRVRVDLKAPRKIVDIEVTDIPTLFDTASFFNSRSIDQLIAEQHIQPIADISVLSGAIPDEDVDEFVADIYRDRKR